MLLKYFYDKKLAQASYMAGCPGAGEALIIDPARDISPYLEAAEAEGLRITHVTETHIHADFVSGSRELAAATGAQLYLSDEGDENWKYQFVDDDPKPILVYDGDTFMVGAVKVQVFHTPGHTPEHISFMITDTVVGDEPMGVFTGDFLFVGDVGRPDLLEEAAGILGTKDAGARLQFRNVEYFKTLPDYLQIWPGHGAGSACGKALGAVPSTTLGYEKRFNPAFQFKDEDAFVAWLLDGQPEAPRYFAQMKRVNKQGPALLNELPTPDHLNGAAFATALQQRALIIDARSTEQYMAKHAAGTLHIPATSGGFNTYVGWFVDFDAPTYLLAAEDDIPDLLRDLRMIGVDNVPGYFSPEVVYAMNGTALQTRSISAPELAAQPDVFVLDVRGATEHAAYRIEGSTNIPLGHLPRHIEQLPQDRPIVAHCVTGVRSSVAASYLRSQGFEQVTSLADPIDTWATAGLPVIEG